MYQNATAVYRPDIQAFLMQAGDLEKKFIAEKIFPVHNVKKRAGQYPRIRIAEGSLMRKDVTKRNVTGTYNEITRKHSWDNFTLQDRGLKVRIDDDKAAEMDDFFDLEVIESKLLKRSMLLDLETEAAAALMNPATFATENAKVAYTEANILTADFPFDMLLAFEKLNSRGVDANTIVLSHTLWRYIRRSKLLQDYLFGSEPSKKKLIKAKDISEAFSEETGTSITVEVASANIDSSNRAKEVSTLGPIWGNSHIWLGKTAGGDFNAGGMGRTLSWTQAVKSGLFETESWRDEERRGDMIRVRSYADQKVIDETAGQLIATAFA
jgi:hypothetical protein